MYTVQDFCLHPEYVEPLRQEMLASADQQMEMLSQDKGFPLLDSFIKESMRMNTCDAGTYTNLYSVTSDGWLQESH